MDGVGGISVQRDVDLLEGRPVGVEGDRDGGALTGCCRCDGWVWRVVFDGERGGRRGQLAVEECHFGLDAYEHVVECAIFEGLEEDVAAVVG